MNKHMWLELKMWIKINIKRSELDPELKEFINSHEDLYFKILSIGRMQSYDRVLGMMANLEDNEKK